MFLIVGYVIILASALGTYAVHGSLLALWVPLEYIAIIGLMIGYFVASNNIGLIKATVGAIPGVLKGSKYNKAYYIDALAMLAAVIALLWAGAGWRNRKGRTAQALPSTFEH